MSDKFLLVVAGWEDRFISGVLRDIEDFSPDRVIVLFSGAYEEWTKCYRSELHTACLTRGVIYFEKVFDFSNPVDNFPMLSHALNEQLGEPMAKVRFNGTTAPRDIIWSILHLLGERGDAVQFTYYKTKSYGTWLSRDADVPRLAIKRSGLMYPDLHTCLLVLSGYDDHRLVQLIRKFEPRKVLVGRQSGAQLGNSERNQPAQKDFGVEIDCFEIDCFDVLAAESLVMEKLQPISQSYNIIAASLGPKISAAILFKVTQKLPSVGLVYIPAKEYNRDYSAGVDLDDPCVIEM